MTPLGITVSILVTALLSYLIGAIPFGYLIGKMHGKDIRQFGSGNIGATNVTRVIGRGWGKICFAFDFLKGALPVFVVSCLTPKEVLPFLTSLLPESLEAYVNTFPDPLAILPSISAFATVCGHIWPVSLKFKGGKGVSTAAGAILALNPLSLLVAAALWCILFLSTRYVSLASVLAAASLPVCCLVFHHFHISSASGPEIILFFLLAVLTILKHSSNIKRLLNGTENRFDKKRQTESK